MIISCDHIYLVYISFGVTSLVYQLEGWQDGLEVCTLISKLSSLGLNPDPAINCHPGVPQAG